ncbi:hypothetical protein [Kribbella sp. NPDC004536]|uniref:hypothetical protein n=1 Tax=Kribbella sp. NPDC004536 TaxID=3364106 RepID=UPI003698413E
MRTLIAAGLAVVLLAGCGGPGQETAPSVPPLVSVSSLDTPSATPSDTPTPTASATPAETVCMKLDQELVRTTLAVPAVDVQTKATPTDFGIPTYDVCQLTLSNFPNGPVLNVETSVLPATAATLAATQKAYKGEPVKPVVVGDGGYGASTFVVFLVGGKLYKVAGPKATLAKYVVLAQEVAQQAVDVPTADPVVTLPDCDRGSSAAEKVLGARPTARRDSETAQGDPVCGWITASGLLTTSVRHTPQAKALIAPLSKAATSQSIPFGDEGYVDTATGRTTIRVGDDKLVDFVPLPARAINPDVMTQFALAMASVYTH